MATTTTFYSKTKDDLALLVKSNPQVAIQLAAKVRRMKDRLDQVNQAKSVLRNRINVTGLSFGVVVLKVYPKSANPKAVSRTFLAIVGSVQGVGLPPEQIQGDTILLEVEVKQAPSNQQQQPPQQNQASQAIVAVDRGFQLPRGASQQSQNEPVAQSPKEFYPITEYKVYRFSAPDNEIKDIGFGDIVRLRGVRVKQSTFNGKTSNFVNVDNIEKDVNISHLDTYYAFLPAVMGPSHIVKSDKKPTKDDTSTHYGDDSLLIRVGTNMTLESDLLMKKTHIAMPKYFQQDQDWVTADRTDKPQVPCLKGSYYLFEWNGDKYNDELPAILHFEAYEDALKCFGLADPKTWRDIGPNILPLIPHIAFGRENVLKTESIEYNAKSVDSRGGNQAATKAVDIWKYVMCIHIDGMLADTPGAFLEIGVPVTVDFARRAYEDDRNPQYGLIDKIKALHNRNIHSTNLRPPMICLNEYNGDPIPIWSSPDVEFRVITNTELKPETIRLIKTLNPKDGVALLNTVSGGTKIPDPGYGAEHPVNKIMLGARDTLVTYTFAIFKDRLPKTRGPAVQMFIEGTKNPATEEYDPLAPVHEEENGGGADDNSEESLPHKTQERPKNDGASLGKKQPPALPNIPAKKPPVPPKEPEKAKENIVADMLKDEEEFETKITEDEEAMLREVEAQETEKRVEKPQPDKKKHSEKREREEKRDDRKSTKKGKHS